MITLHHLENSQSIRIIWLLEELAAEYHLKCYQRSPETSLAPDDYKALHPMGTAPILTEGAFKLAETNAIIEYILDQYPETPLRPAPGSPARNAYLYWFHAVQGTFTPLLIEKLIFSRMISKSPALIRPIIRKAVGKVEESFLHPRLYKMLAQIEAQLTKTDWLTGDSLTAADIVIGFCLEAGNTRLDLSNKYPGIKGFLTRMHARPAYIKAIEKGNALHPLKT